MGGMGLHGWGRERRIAGKENLDQVALSQNIIRPDRRAVYMDGREHLQPPEGMLAERETARHNGAHSAACVLCPGGIRQDAHGTPPCRVDASIIAQWTAN